MTRTSPAAHRDETRNLTHSRFDTHATRRELHGEGPRNGARTWENERSPGRVKVRGFNPIHHLSEQLDRVTMSVEQDQTNSGEKKRPVSRYQVLASLIEACDLGEGVDYSAITTLRRLHDWDDGSNFTDPGDPGRHLCDEIYETFAHIWNTQEW